ncbi:MAG: hypothetical protein HYX65_06360 [Gemmatimonadetes bacterium]|nr:hypothetical protein [Gemmatimonadota bacterium]
MEDLGVRSRGGAASQWRLIVLIGGALLCGAPLRGQYVRPERSISSVVDSSTGTATAKEVSSAVVLGLVIPGGGQLYAGRRTLGAALLATAMAAPVIGYLGVALTDRRTGCTGTSGVTGSACNNSALDQRPLNVGLVIAAATWAYGLATAPGDIRAWNAAHSPPRTSILLDGSPERARAGVTIRMSW